MKLSELRPCDNCGGKIAPMFYIVRSSIVIITPKANEVLGLAQYFGGGGAGLELAEVMGPEPDVVKIGGDQEPELWDEFYLCPTCFIGDVNLGILKEKINAKREAAQDERDSMV